MSSYDSKIIRDLVHDYINPGEFELSKIIDTAHFQRLKDIRQLTCQHVYPNARHTRFEHSLGVYELTKRAIRHINKNGFIGSQPFDTMIPIISPQNQFFTQIAALLHDVGHCPFSHMGELQMNRESIVNELLDAMQKINGSKLNTFSEELLTLVMEEKSDKHSSANHELLSCIIIIRHYYQILNKIPKSALSLSPEEQKNAEEYYSADFELIVRCILGKQYSTELCKQSATQNNTNENTININTLRTERMVKNLCIRLISDSAFDMDKLDYIMRDALYTGIGTPRIDTKRLFRAMKIDKDYRIVFTSKAVPALQSIIESRDSLYLWVYNHHTVVYSDFIYNYIFRRLNRNARRLLLSTPKSHNPYMNICGCFTNNLIFSVDAICNRLYSDCDVQAILNIQYRNYAELLQLRKLKETT